MWAREFRQDTESAGFVIVCVYEVPKKKVMVSYGEGIVLSFVTDKSLSFARENGFIIWSRFFLINVGIS